jgi:hypothetical protein
MTDTFSDKVSWNGLYKETLGLCFMLSKLLLLQTRYNTWDTLAMLIFVSHKICEILLFRISQQLNQSYRFS